MYCTKKGKRSRSVRGCVCFICKEYRYSGEKIAFVIHLFRILQEASGVVDLIVLHKCEMRLQFSVGK